MRSVSSHSWSDTPRGCPSGSEPAFTDIPNNRIMKWTPEGKLTVFIQPSGYRGAARFTGPESGSNGMTRDRQGRPTVAGHAARMASQVAGKGRAGDKYEGKRLNSPNDLVYKSEGSLYFIDPPYAEQLAAC